MKAVQPLLIFLGLAVAASVSADAVTFTSSDRRTALLELFSSQGCSSCPPAESWMGNYLNDSSLWTDVVPVVWHVDYWDRLGWPDPFAQESFTRRQRAYRLAGRIRSVYTPCFVENGQEWRGFFNRQPYTPDRPAAPGLTVTWGEEFLEADVPGGEGPYELNAAFLGADLETAVLRGENAGRTLKQQFVVLNYKQHPTAGSNWRLRKFPRMDDQGGRKALAVWITREGESEPVQAVGGWLP